MRYGAVEQMTRDPVVIEGLTKRFGRLVAVKNLAATQHTKSRSHSAIESLFRLRADASKVSTVNRGPDRLFRQSPGDGGRTATRV